MHSFCIDNTHLSRKVLASEFNNEFGTDRLQTAIESFCKRNGYLSLHDGRFSEGRVSWNKGKTGWCAPGADASWFKKGHRPVNASPVGFRRKTPQKLAACGKVLDSGMWKVKVAEPNQWEFEHRQLWERTHGAIPKGHALIFLDGDQDNIVIENLTLLSRGELAMLNKFYGHYTDCSTEERLALIKLSKLRLATSKIQFSDHDQAIAESNGLSRGTARARVMKGWPKQLALTAPVGYVRPKQRQNA